MMNSGACGIAAWNFAEPRGLHYADFNVINFVESCTLGFPAHPFRRLAPGESIFGVHA